MKDYKNPDMDDILKLTSWYLRHLASILEQDLKERRAELFTMEIRARLCHAISGR